jgi:hypothetical protein
MREIGSSEAAGKSSASFHKLARRPTGFDERLQ